MNTISEGYNKQGIYVVVFNDGTTKYYNSKDEFILNNTCKYK